RKTVSTPREKASSMDKSTSTTIHTGNSFTLTIQFHSHNSRLKLSIQFHSQSSFIVTHTPWPYTSITPSTSSHLLPTGEVLPLAALAPQDSTHTHTHTHPPISHRDQKEP